MTEQPYDDSSDAPTEENMPNWRRRLEADAKAGREAQALIEAANNETRKAQRELAMARAGIDITSPLGTMFARAYDGEVDVDLIKAEYAKIQPGAPGTPQVSPDTAAALARISDAQAGGAPSGGAPHDFAAELDSIPMIVDGQYNPAYKQAILTATAAQAAREGRQFATDNVGDIKGWAQGSGPVTTPL